MTNKLLFFLGLLLPGSLLFLLLWEGIRRWLATRRRLKMRLIRLYLRSLMAMCCDRCRHRFPLLHLRMAPQALAEAVSRVYLSVADCDPALLRSVVRIHDLEHHLLRTLRWPWQREETLRLLASLPVGDLTARRLSCFRPWGRRERFYLLVARLNASPREALSLLRRFEEPFTPFECRLLLSMVVRGVLPLPYRELLSAPESNLRLLGLRIVRHFSLMPALPQVMAMTEDPQLGGEALRTLCDLGLPLSVEVERLSAAERRSLLRRAAQQGYAIQGVESLLRGEDRLYFERLAASYTSTELWA